MKKTKRELEREIKKLQKVTGLVREIVRKDKVLARKRARRWFTPAEVVELQIHTHFMLGKMRKLKKSLSHGL